MSRPIGSATILRVASVLLLGVALSGCGGGEPTGGPGWASEFERARSEQSSEFAQAVLRDDVISDMEYMEAQVKYVDCLAARGIPGAEFTDDGSSSIPDHGYTSEQVTAAQDVCNDEVGFSAIQFLYLAVRGNPDNVDPNTLQAACLVRKGVVEPSYSAADYKRDVETFLKLGLEGRDLAGAIDYTNHDAGPGAFYDCAQDPSS